MKKSKPALGSPEFKALEKKWYDKLKEEGFKDAEDVKGPNRFLKAWHGQRFKHISPDVMQATVDHYDRARDLLLTYKFKKKSHRRIWEMYCAGHSTYEIADALKRYNYKQHYSPQAVAYIIVRIRGSL